jgi:hypothetical protein
MNVNVAACPDTANNKTSVNRQIDCLMVRRFLLVSKFGGRVLSLAPTRCDSVFFADNWELLSSEHVDVTFTK